MNLFEIQYAIRVLLKADNVFLKCNAIFYKINVETPNGTETLQLTERPLVTE